MSSVKCPSCKKTFVLKDLTSYLSGLRSKDILDIRCKCPTCSSEWTIFISFKEAPNATND